jgi:two-component system OmpR family response regulator
MPSTAPADGERADFLARTEQYDAVVLDLGLPKNRRTHPPSRVAGRRYLRARAYLDGARKLARKSTGNRRWGGRLRRQALSHRGVLARIRALIRRSTGLAQAELRCGALAVDPRTSRVSLGGAPVKLTSHEFRVLSYLMHHAGRVVSRTELTEHIYSQDFDRDSNTVEVFIARLRRKLGPSFIETVRGLGYRMREAS